MISNKDYFSEPNGKKVVCGEWKLDTIDTNEKVLPITQIINHPNFDATSLVNDIAVVKVSGSFNCEQEKIYPVCVPSEEVSKLQSIFHLIQSNNFQKFTYEGWVDTIASGWGATSFGSEISNTLQFVQVPPIPDGTCNEPESYNGAIDSTTMICAGPQKLSDLKFFCNFFFLISQD